MHNHSSSLIRYFFFGEFERPNTETEEAQKNEKKNHTASRLNTTGWNVKNQLMCTALSAHKCTKNEQKEEKDVEKCLNSCSPILLLRCALWIVRPMCIGSNALRKENYLIFVLYAINECIFFGQNHYICLCYRSYESWRSLSVAVVVIASILFQKKKSEQSQKKRQMPEKERLNEKKNTTPVLVCCIPFEIHV